MTAGADKSLVLVRIAGPADDLVAERIVVRTHEERPSLIVGRSASADVCLPDPAVSRRHARFDLADEGWTVLDLGSSGGLFLNSTRCGTEAPQPLREGDRLRIGPWVFRVGDGPGEEPSSTLATISMDAAAGTVTASRPARRLAALSACIDRMAAGLGSEEAIAAAALETVLAGAGFARGAVLRVDAAGERGEAEVIAAVRRADDGRVERINASGLRVSRTLVERAAAGETATLVERGSDGRSAATSRSLADLEIHSAVAAPARLDGRTAAVLYVDARAGESAVPDAASFCADVAAVLSLGLAASSRAELLSRQSVLRAEMERAASLRELLTPREVVRAGPVRAAHVTTPGLFVSGDLFDATDRADSTALVLFGDATGHGFGAAILSSLVHAHLAAGAGAAASDPLDAVGATNRFLGDRPTSGHFVSLWAGVFEPGGGVRFIDAGHGLWLVMRRGGEPEPAARRDGGGPPLGVGDAADFPRGTLALGAGERVVLVTDGVTETRDEETGEQVELAGVMRVLRGSTSAEEDVARVRALLGDPGAGPRDDASVASVEMLPHAG